MKCPFKKQIKKESSCKSCGGDHAFDTKIITTEFGECDEHKCMSYNPASMKCDLVRGV